MSRFLAPGLILLREDTESSQGNDHIIGNIIACQAVVSVVRTTLGPRGMDKLIEQRGGETIITNDGVTIMRELRVVHPAAKVLVDISIAQDAEVGDGTTSVVVFAGELLREAHGFIDDGVSPPQIIKGYRAACAKALQRLREIAIDLAGQSSDAKRSTLVKCAETALNSKLVSDYKRFFAEMAVDAISHLGDDLAISTVGIKKVTGGSITDTSLVDGVAFKKTFSYAGFEQQPKYLQSPKILLLNLELELKAEKDNAEVRVSSPEQYQSVVEAEWAIIYEKLDAIAGTGASVVLSSFAIGDLATQYFADRHIFAAGRVASEDLERLRCATGAEVQATTHSIAPAVLGACGVFEEKQIGDERYNFFTDCLTTKTATVLLRGGAQQFVDEAARSLHDALMVVRRATRSTKVVGGGGAIEMELSRHLREHARTMSGKQQMVTHYYARALEAIPMTLAQNSGVDGTRIINQLRTKHALGSEETRWFGVDCICCSIADMLAAHVWEPVGVKESMLSAATEAACTILSIDQTLKVPQQEQPQGSKEAGKGKGKGRGFGRGRRPGLLGGA